MKFGYFRILDVFESHLKQPKEGPMIRASFFDACFSHQANIYTTMRLGPRRHTGFHLVPVTITNIPHDRKPFYMACPHEVADVTGMQKMQDVTGKNRSFHHDGRSLRWCWCHFSVSYVWQTLLVPLQWVIGYSFFFGCKTNGFLIKIVSKFRQT